MILKDSISCTCHLDQSQIVILEMPSLLKMTSSLSLKLLKRLLSKCQARTSHRSCTDLDRRPNINVEEKDDDQNER